MGDLHGVFEKQLIRSLSINAVSILAAEVSLIPWIFDDFCLVEVAEIQIS